MIAETQSAIYLLDSSDSRALTLSYRLKLVFQMDDATWSNLQSIKDVNIELKQIGEKNLKRT